MVKNTIQNKFGKRINANASAKVKTQMCAKVILGVLLNFHEKILNILVVLLTIQIYAVIETTKSILTNTAPKTVLWQILIKRGEL